MVANLELDAPELGQICQYLSERSPQPMVAVDGTTHVVSYVNPAFARLVGKERKDLMGRPFAEAVPEGIANGCVALLDRVFRTGRHENLAEQEHRQVELLPVYWSYAVWAIIGDDHRPSGVMIQVTDSTETAVFRRQIMEMNEALLLSSTRQHELAAAAESLSKRLQTAVDTRDRFLAVLSHELRNPLAPLAMGLKTLKLAGLDPVVTEKSWAMMDRQVTRMVRLVDDLLDVSRLTAGRPELSKKRVALKALMRDAVEGSQPLIDALSHELTVTLPIEPIFLEGDPTRLAQIFLNLLNNAAKYSEPGASIWLSAKQDGNMVAVSIRDTGIGISAAHLPNIFEAFVQVDTSWERAQGGLGIGLSLVKEFVGLHGGRVEVHSDGLGKGSEFVVYLPVASAAEAELPAAVIETPRGPGRRILVADDNNDAAESLAMMLEIMGHEVRTASDGEAAVSITADFRPDLVLMDLGMPRLTGYEAARQIRAQPLGNLPYLVALTGWGADEDRRRTQDAGFDRHLVKPVELDTLNKMIAEMPVRSS